MRKSVTRRATPIARPAIRSVAVFVSAWCFLGCAGAKFMSSSRGTHEMFGPVPAEQTLVVGKFSTGSTYRWSGLDAGQYFTVQLAREIERKGLFDHVLVDTCTSPTCFAEEALHLVGSVDFSSAGYGSRAFSGKSSSVTVSASLRDSSRKIVLATFSKTRSATGGVFGMGGWLAAGEASLARTTLRWVAQDIARVLADEMRSGPDSIGKADTTTRAGARDRKEEGR